MQNSRGNRKIIGRRAQRQTIKARPDTRPSQTAPSEDNVLDRSYREDIRQLNRKFLLLAREMSRHNPEMASCVMGIPAGMQTILAGLSFDTIDRVLAHPHVVQFALRFPDVYWGKVKDHPVDEKDDPEDQMIFRVLAAAHSLAEGEK